MDSFDYDSLLDVDTNGLRGGAARVRALVSTFTPQAIEIGRILKQSKAVLPHGRFGAMKRSRSTADSPKPT